jgi:iron transport multicopper oxidase
VNGKGKQNIYLDVEANKIYRLRLVNAADLGYYNFAIAGHSLSVIAEGTMATTPVSLQSLDIAASQRFDVLLNTNMPVATYRIQIQTNWRGLDMSPSGLFTTVYLRYAGSTSLSTLAPHNETKPWNAQTPLIVPANTQMVPITADKTFWVDQGQQYINPKTYLG